MENNQPKNARPINFWERLLSSDAILVIIFSLLSYVMVISFDLGYFSYFSLPVYLIVFDISKVVNFISRNFLYFSLIIVVLILYLLLKTQYKRLGKIKWSLIILPPIASSIPAISSFLLGRFNPVLLIFPLVIVITGIVLFIRNPIAREVILKGDEVFDLLYGEFFKKNTRLILGIISLSLIYLFFDLGHYSASIIEGYVVVDLKPECVILYVTRDNTAICGKFDRNKKEVDNSFRLVKLSENIDLEYNFQYVGPLHLKPTPTPTFLPTPTPIQAKPTQIPITPTP